MANNTFSLEPESSSCIHRIPDGLLHEFPTAFSRPHAYALFEELLESLPWEHAQIRIGGKLIPIPRLQCWMGDQGASYRYSGLDLTPLSWHPRVLEIRTVVERLAGQSFNSVLINLYRNEQDSVAWHSDSERELGSAPIIASVSLGEERPFELRHKKRKDLGKIRLILRHGSLLVMGPTVQTHWLHQLPKLNYPVSPRINLTFRRILPTGALTIG